MGNYSKNPQTVFQDAVQKGYSRVRFQQGKPILDRELNLASDLAAPNRVLRHYVGSGVPEGSDGFFIDNLNANTHDFTIRAGRAVVNGLEVVLNSGTTYKNQPHKGRVGPFPYVGIVYLRAFTVEVNEAQDPDLKNASDIGFETALRERVDWEVYVTDNLSFSEVDFLLGILVYNPGDTLPPPDSEVEASIVKALADRPTERALAERAFAESAAKKASEAPPSEKQTTTTTTTTTTKTTSTSTATTTEKEAAPTETTPAPQEPQEPFAMFYDMRLRGLTLSRVRGDLDLIMAPDHSGLADNTVRVRNLATRVLQEASITLGAGQSSTLSLGNTNIIGSNPYILVSVWGTGSFTWSERVTNNDRQLVITNTASIGQATVNMKALLIFL